MNVRLLLLVAVLSGSPCLLYVSNNYLKPRTSSSTELLARVLQAEETDDGCPRAPPPARRPNIVFLLTDDQDSVLGGDWHMPQLSKHLAAEGVNFTACITNFALCCPSRATILTGMCAHNTGIVSLYYPMGGASLYKLRGLEEKSAHFMLQQAGYRTGLVGKWLNTYDTEFTASYIPPGHDTWFAMRKTDYYKWSASDQGVHRDFGYEDKDYSTDVLTDEAVKFIHRHRNDSRPFFLYLAPFAPHVPWTPARRHVGKLAGLKVPRVPSFNESSSSIKKKVSPVLNQMIPINQIFADALDIEYQARAETMLAVDDQIAAVLQALESIGELDNTYFFLTSDNGFKLGTRRKTGKMSPYEEDVRVPLYVRGPGVPRGVQLPHLVSNTDFLPTFLELAGAPDPYADLRDGKSFAPLLRSTCERDRSPDTFRVGMLIEKIDTKIGARMVSRVVERGGKTAARLLDSLHPQELPNGSWPFITEKCSLKKWNASYEGICKVFVGDANTPDDDEVILRRYLLDSGPGAGVRRNLAEGHGSEHPLDYTQYPLNYTQRLHMSIDQYRHSFRAPYTALRIQSTQAKFKFIHYNEGYELYDLSRDPYEVDNIFANASEALIQYLQRNLKKLEKCSGQDCSVENLEELRKALEKQ